MRTKTYIFLVCLVSAILDQLQKRGPSGMCGKVVGGKRSNGAILPCFLLGFSSHGLVVGIACKPLLGGLGFCYFWKETSHGENY